MIHYTRNIYFGKQIYEGLLRLMQDRNESASQIVKKLIEREIKKLDNKERRSISVDIKAE